MSVKTNSAALPPPAITAADAEQQGPQPPTYDSLFKKLKKAKTDSTQKTDLCKSVATIITGSDLMNVVAAIGVVILIAGMAIGATFLRKCPAKTFIPVQLIVAGVVGMILVLIGVAENINEKNQNKPVSETALRHRKHIAGLKTILFFSFVVCFIVGNVNVYGLLHKWVSEPSTAENYCHPVLYYYDFWFITGHYIVVGVLILTSILLSVIA